MSYCFFLNCLACSMVKPDRLMNPSAFSACRTRKKKTLVSKLSDTLKSVHSHRSLLWSQLPVWATLELSGLGHGLCSRHFGQRAKVWFACIWGPERSSSPTTTLPASTSGPRSNISHDVPGITLTGPVSDLNLWTLLLKNITSTFKLGWHLPSGRCTSTESSSSGQTSIFSICCPGSCGPASCGGASPDSPPRPDPWPKPAVDSWLRGDGDNWAS